MELYISTMAISCQNAQNFFIKKRAESRVFPGKIPLFLPIILTTVPRLQRLSPDRLLPRKTGFWQKLPGRSEFPIKSTQTVFSILPQTDYTGPPTRSPMMWGSRRTRFQVCFSSLRSSYWRKLSPERSPRIKKRTARTSDCPKISDACEFRP